MKAALSIDCATFWRLRAAGAWVWLATCVQAVPQSLTLSQRIKLSLVTRPIDHLDIDLAGNRLFVAVLAFDSIEIIIR